MGDIFVGSAPIISRRYGTTEIVKVYVGDERIWPAAKIVSLYTSQIFIATNGAFNTHQIGDLLVVVAVSATTTAPTLPAGWTSVYTSPASETMAVRVGYRFATVTNTTTGTWTNASWLSTFIFRDADTTTPFGAISSLLTTANTKGNAPALTLVNSKGESDVAAAFINNGSSGSFAVGAQPDGWLAKNRNARIVNNEKIDTRSVSATYETLVGGGSVNWRGTTFEILPPAPAAPQYLYDCTSVASAGYVVDFTILDGWPAGDINEAYMFRCSTLTGYDGYVGRNFQKTFRSTAYNSYDCTLEDLSNIPGKTRQTISFKCYPRA